MTPAPPWGRDFRCAGAAEDRGDELAGTATHLRAFLLLEQDGGWGTTVLGDSALPVAVRRHLRGHPPVKCLLIRGHHRGSRQGRLRAYVALPASATLLSVELEDPTGLLALDMEALARGEPPPDWSVTDEPMYLACTHGRHDLCCAERGRPAAAALAQARPDHAWEVSHIGGDRYAGNVLVLPEGLYYGRMDETAALALPDLHEQGLLDLDHLRGRATGPMWVQYADVALRRHLDQARRDAVRLLQARGGTARFAVEDAVWQVSVRRTTTGAAPLTCQAAGEGAVPKFQVSALERI